MSALIDKLVAAHTELETMAADVAAAIRDDNRECMHDDFEVLEWRGRANVRQPVWVAAGHVRGPGDSVELDVMAC